MADSQFNPLGSVTAPADWQLPPSLNLLLKNVYASYDGTGAGGSFQPCLQIISDSGHTVGSYPCPTSVAAGGSADVTWFPRLAAPATATGLPWLFVTRSPGASLASATSYSEVDLNPALGSVRWGSDGSGDVTLANVGDGTYGPSFNANGLYLVTWQAGISVNAAPAAGSGANSRFTGASYYPVSAGDVVPFTQSVTGAGTYFADAGFAAVVNIDPASQSPPQVLSVQVAQDSTHSASTFYSLLVQKVNPTGSGNF